MKAISVIGGRQHIIKAHAVHRDMVNAGIEHFLVDMGGFRQSFAKSTYKELELPDPFSVWSNHSGDHQFDEVKPSAEYLKNVFLKVMPNVVLVYGDIMYSVAACYAALENKTPLAHIEAGLRNHDLGDTEERNRLFIDNSSNLLFSTSEQSKNNLISEGISSSDIYVGGNAVISSLRKNLLNKDDEVIKKLGLIDLDYAVITLHREENLRSKTIATELLYAIEEISNIIPIIFIQYPETQRAFAKFGIQQFLNNIQGVTILNTVSYRKYLGILASCKLVITDSSGIQDESAYLGKPCVICRDHSHREAISQTDIHQLAGTNSAAISGAAFQLMRSQTHQPSFPSDWEIDTGKIVSAALLNRYG